MGASEEKIDTSIVVATCSRVGLLRGALESLLAQAREGAPRFEIVVVDDGSTDETPGLLSEMEAAAQVPFRVVCGTRSGVAAARNLGCSVARGTWLASFDDDQVALPGWLAGLRGLAKSTGAACVGGALELALPEGFDAGALGSRARRVLGEHLPGEAERRYRTGEFPATNNVLIRADVFRELGGYDTSFAEGGEDKDFFERAEAAGHELWFQPQARALHVTPALRLERRNLRWTSLRLGASDVRLAQRKSAYLGPLRLALVRLATLLLRDVWGLTASGGARRRDVWCSVWYTQGVLRSLGPMLFPGVVRSEFLGAMDFRARNGERRERVGRG